jgi:hypothetical protein
MSNIPQARERLTALAEAMADSGKHDWAAEVADIVEMMHRKRIKKITAPATSRKITPKLALEIYYFCRNHPEMSHQKVAHIFSVNQGRVTEILERGYRYYYRRYMDALP